MKKICLFFALAMGIAGAANALDEVGGWYQIRTAQDLVDYSNLVNNSNNGAKAILLNDIDMSGIENFTPIGLFADNNGVQTTFRGEFNGNGYVVKHLTVVIEHYEVGMFSRINGWDGARVYNLGVVDSYFESTNGIRAGAIGGEILGMKPLTGCFGVNNTIVTSNDQKGGLAGEAYDSDLSRCYTDYAVLSGSWGNLIDNSKQGVSIQDIMSGKLCFEMNNFHTYTPLWRQDLNGGGYPVVSNVAPQVTKLLRSDTYTNDHNFIDGVCRECVDYFYQEDYMTPEADGYYHISTPEQLMWFSVFTCHLHDNANAKLTADIDMSGITDYYGIGLCGGSENYPYRGIFNGQGHVISNLTVYRTEDLETGFFGRTWGATISNLGFMGDFTITNTYGQRCGVLGGEIAASSVNNVFVRANSITYNPACDSFQRGALGGEGAMTTYTGCYTTETAYTGWDTKDDTHFVNCFNNANGEVNATHVSGELCARLGTGWYQNIDNGEPADEWPTLDPSHGSVYLTCDGTSFSNSSGHNYQNGICQNCWMYQEPGFDSELNAYTIGNLGQLIRYSQIVNQENQSANGSLVCDIDMEYSDEFTPIGLNNDAEFQTPFRGTFYGNNHVIRNLYVKTNCEGGLFSRLRTGRIYNLGLENGYIESTANLRCGAIAGEHHDNAYMYNCYARGTFQFVTTHGQKDALAAETAGGHFVNCYTTLPKMSCDYPADGTSENSYEAVTAEQAATGEICFRLGNSFRQTIGEDTYPELDQTRGIVFQMGNSCYATLYNDETAGMLSDNVSVYTGKKGGDYISLTEEANTIPAQTAVVLKGSEGYYSFTPVASAPNMVGTNDLLGTSAPLTATGSEYVLAMLDGEVGFYKAIAGSVIPAGKAYVTSTSGVKGFRFIGDDATFINEELRNKNEEFSIYNIAGQRIQKMQKGINIANGKKILK